MKTYSCLLHVIANSVDYDVFNFDNETDAVNTLGGRIICGFIEKGYYLVCNDRPFDDGICDAIMYHYGDTQYLYRIDDL